MPTQTHSLKDQLARSDEITISVKGRKSGRTISNPVWFVLENDRLDLLPVKGSDTQWYQNVLKNPALSVATGTANAQVKAVPITDLAQVKSVIEKFRRKYGNANIKKYYSKLDVAVFAKLN